MKYSCFLTSPAILRGLGKGQFALVFCLLCSGLDLLAQQVQVYTETVNGVSFNMVYVEGGKFTMGCTGGDKDCNTWESPLSEVTLSSYRIGETEVTQALWRAVMGDNPSETKCDECPVTNVSWEDAKAFVHQMTKLTGKTYDLPTEAQWEYAARGGQTTISHPGKVDRYAWHLGNSENTLHQVGQKLTNGLGLSDMLGGVWEMCSDWYGPYTNTPKIDPVGPKDGTKRVARGGSRFSPPLACRSSNRDRVLPRDELKSVGFRLVSK